MASAHKQMPLLIRKKPKLVILDRDGVLNYDSDAYIKSVGEWQPIPGSMEAIARLCRQGILVALATNQSGLARGFFSLKELNEMHGKLLGLTEKEGGRIARIAFCPHLPEENCLCRKPKNGMLRLILSELSVEAQEACFVGDTYKDYLAARSLSIPFFLVRTGKGERELRKHPELLDKVPVFSDLSDFVDRIFM